MAYLRGHFVPEDEKEEKRMALRARNYRIIGEELYRGGVCAPLLRCISREEGKQLLEEIHAGKCSSHIATRALVGKAFREGFYWPSAVVDAHEVVRTCPNCQKHALLTFTNAPDLYTASARFVVAFPLEYSPKVYQSVDRQ